MTLTKRSNRHFSTEVLETLTLKTAVVAAELILKHALLSECQCEISE